ncbi:MAG: 16S rRNA (guanine(527)-N(7))-methyltransferase RsmG [Saprospiraceae bacterium]|nr:16S rRNA (guanine(527)-N(7))-methyltransferase RsmG [Saprospiraceae bacterium]
MEIIRKYFPELTTQQFQQFEVLQELYREWNDQINVISRKDIENLYLHHVLHSLAIARYIRFKPGSRLLDLGTGGGFPGIPLAIMFPECQFLLVDSIGKKLKVVNEIAAAIGLNNVTTSHSRVEDLKQTKVDFVLTRAAASIDKIFQWSRKLISGTHINAFPNGIIALKGGNIKAELKLLPKGEYYEVIQLTKYFDEPYFEEKVLVYLQG